VIWVVFVFLFFSKSQSKLPAYILPVFPALAVLIGRWLLAEPRILLLYDITRGVDVSTKHELYKLVVELAKQGHSVLIYSSDASELAHLCHRVLVMREGRIAKELTGDAISTENIVSSAVRDAA